MAIDPYFTSAWKKPRVNHAHDPAWERFKALPRGEQFKIIEGIFDRRREGKQNTPEELSLVARHFVTRRARKHAHRMSLVSRNITVTNIRRCVGGYNTNPK